MAEIVNLRMARKAKQRAAKETEAAVNRAKFGQPKDVKTVQRMDAERAANLLDGAKRDPD
jgi:hypothetical protein